MNNSPVNKSAIPTTAVVLVAAWFGLVTGLIEGAAFMFLQKFYWLNRNVLLMDVSIEIIWISAVFNLILFSIIGVVLAVSFRPFRRLQHIFVYVFLFSFLAIFDWLALMLSKRMYYYAIFAIAVGLAVTFTRWFRKREAAILRFWRRSLPWVVAAAVLALVGIEGGILLRERSAIANLPPAAAGSQNVLIIVIDTLRADHLSSHGYARPTSPNIDRVAREGVLFENAFATSSWTPPSHASMLTGRYPGEHGLEWDNPRALFDSPYPTLSEALLTRGYRTGAFSANQTWFTRPMGFGRGFIQFEDFFHSIGDMAFRTLFGRAIEQVILRRLGYEDAPSRKRASDINRSVLRWIERDREKPFFAFLNYIDCHDPYLPPQPYRSKFSKLEHPGGMLNWRLGRHHPQMTPEQLQGEIDAYDGAIAYVDDYVGQLLAEIQKRGLAENTLVVITSDHGESFGEHDLFLHANALYRELIQVPLIIWQPGQVPAGVRFAQPVTNAALPATVMDLIGGQDQTLFPGPPLTKFWKNAEAHTEWPYPLAEMAQQPWAPETFPVYHGSMKSLVSPQWHYILHKRFDTELYDFRNDAQEAHNLAGRPEMEDVVTQFRSLLYGGHRHQTGRLQPLSE